MVLSTIHTQMCEAPHQRGQAGPGVAPAPTYALTVAALLPMVGRIGSVMCPAQAPILN